MRAPTITTRQADWLLYNRAWLRQVADAMAESSPCVGRRAAQSTISHPTEMAAIRREDLMVVLDVVDRALRSMPADVREVVRVRFSTAQPTNKEAADQIGATSRTVQRRVSAARAMVVRFLRLVPAQKMSSFWRTCDVILS